MLSSSKISFDCNWQWDHFANTSQCWCSWFGGAFGTDNLWNYNTSHVSFHSFYSCLLYFGTAFNSKSLLVSKTTSKHWEGAGKERKEKEVRTVRSSFVKKVWNTAILSTRLKKNASWHQTSASSHSSPHDSSLGCSRWQKWQYNFVPRFGGCWME